jgi:ligand-binding sensor domain-containing protein
MKSTVLWIVALLLCRGSWSAEADLTLQQLIHKGWTVADGAPGNILAIAQTTDGTLWLASPSGLSRFDGVSFVRYDGPAGRPFESTGIYTIAASGLIALRRRARHYNCPTGKDEVQATVQD